MRYKTLTPTKFRAELWTVVNGRQMWAVIMLDGQEANSPCAFGSKEAMESYAKRLNDCKGILSEL